MRKKNSKFKLSIYTIYILILSLVFVSAFFSSVVSGEKQLYIDCLDIIDENEEFFVSVSDENTYQLENNFIIDFQGVNYESHDDLYITLTTPSVDEDTDFFINASKEGFVSANKIISVLNTDLLELTIDPSSVLIKPGEPFYVTIYDENNQLLEGVTVYIQNYGESKTTKVEGYVVLNAPKDDEKIIVKPKKDGYETASIELTIVSEKPFWSEIIEHRFFPLFVAFIILVIAVIFVHLRQRRSVYSRSKEITDKKVVEKYTSPDNFSNAKKYGYDNPDSSNEMVHVRPSEDSKVEEIRITRPNKQKEVVPVKTEEKKTKKDQQKSDNNEDYDDWFEGTDEIRYELDKLTGEIDEEGIDKWFEGIDSLKDKVNEKMKKKKKERDDNDY